jgi:hemolysin III
MSRRMSFREHRQSLGEEIANSVSHGVGLLAAIVAAPILIVAAVWRGGAAEIVGASIFAATVVVLYSTSTLYHALPESRAKRVFRVLDHGAIFLLIAGTYTPFTLGVLRGAWGWTLFGLVWGLAFAGVALKAAGGVRYPVLSTSLYLAMGWLVLIAVKPLWEGVPMWGLFWLLAGGLAYTVGVAFFAAKRVRYGHFVWHLFVLVGTVCHFIAVLRYAA